MSSQVLGCAVYHQIDPKTQRTEVDGSGKSAIHHSEDLPLASQTHHVLQVHDAQVWISGALPKDHPRVGSDSPFQGLTVADGDQGRLDSEAGQEIGGELASPPVDVLHDDRVISGGEQSHQCGGDRRHARGKKYRALGALQSRQLGLHHLLRGIGITSILIAQGEVTTLLPGDLACSLLLHEGQDSGGILEGVSGCLNNGGRQGTERLGAGLASVNGQGADASTHRALLSRLVQSPSFRKLSGPISREAPRPATEKAPLQRREEALSIDAELSSSRTRFR